MNSKQIKRRKRTLEKFLCAVRPRATWANRAVVQYLYESALQLQKGKHPYTVKSWLRRSGILAGKSAAYAAGLYERSFLRSFDFARYHLELRIVPSIRGKIAYTL